MSGRPPKESLDFSSWDVSILDNDEKIDELIDAQGIGAFTIYFYLCQKAYGSNGYYLEWSYSRCATTARRLGKGASAEYVKNVVDMCFQCCLFDKRLFELYGILTSRGMQTRYWVVAKSRTTQRIIRDYWLLEENECSGLVFRTENSDFQPLKSNYDSPKSNYGTLNESKGENSIVKYSKGEGTLSLAPEEYNSLVSEFGEDKVKQYINHFTEYCNEKNKWKDYPNPAVTIRRWIVQDIEKDKDKPKKSGKFNNYTDTNEIDFKAFEEQILNEMMEG